MDDEINIKLTEREASKLQGVLMLAIIEQNEIYKSYSGKGYSGIAWSHKADAYVLMRIRTKIREQIPFWVEFDKKHKDEIGTQEGETENAE